MLGATHYFGRVRWDSGREHDLEHPVRLDDPAYEDFSLRRQLAKPGEQANTTRFASRAEVVAAFREFLWSEARPTDVAEVGNG